MASLRKEGIRSSFQKNMVIFSTEACNIRLRYQ